MKKIALEEFYGKVLQNEKPVLLEFTGSFCPGCTQMEPVLNQLEVLYGKRMEFLEVDADHSEMLNTLLHVSSLPATFLFDKGKVLVQHRGFWPYHQLEEAIQSAVG